MAISIKKAIGAAKTLNDYCGEKENIDYGLMTGTMRGFDYVQCEKCGALIHAIHIGNEIKAIEAWNRRIEE